MITITYQNRDNGTRQVYVVKPYDELTLGDYKRLTAIPREVLTQEQDMDRMIELVETYAKVPKEVLEKRPMGEVQGVLDFVLAEVAKAHAGSDEFNRNVSENVEYVPPTEIEVGETTYRVPYDLEMDTVAAQWADWQRWDVPEQEADLIAEACAFMLVEKGKEYGGTPKEKVDAIMGMNLCQAFDLCAFFFAKSERFMIATDQRRTLFLTSMRQRLGPGLTHLLEDIEASTSSTEPQK